MISGHSLTTPGKIQKVAAIFAELRRIQTEVLSPANVPAVLKLYARSRPWLDYPLPHVRKAKAAG
jgi:hypothetical protein